MAGTRPPALLKSMVMTGPLAAPRFAHAGSRVRETGHSFLPRIVGGVHVIDFEGPHAVDLDDGLTLGPGEVPHGFGHTHVGTGRQFLAGFFSERFSPAHHKRALDDGDVFVRRVPVRWDLVAVGHLDADRIRAGLAGIAREYCRLGACR